MADLFTVFVNQYQRIRRGKPEAVRVHWRRPWGTVNRNAQAQ